MPGIFEPLDAVKQALMLDASAAMTEAQMYEQSLAAQVAQRRRLARRSPDFADAPLDTLGALDLGNSLSHGTKMSPADYAGLNPHEIAATMSYAQDRAARREQYAQDIMLNRATDEALARARRADAAAAGRPGGMTVDLTDTAPEPVDPAFQRPVLRPQTTSERMFGGLEDARVQQGNEAFYGALPHATSSIPDFAKQLAGQLSVQRQRQLGPDSDIDQLIYEPLPVY